jgi:hypothetical protein
VKHLFPAGALWSAGGWGDTEGGINMADLIAIAYPDETTAAAAQIEAEKLANDLIIQTDAIASIVRDKNGDFKVTTNHHSVAGGTGGFSSASSSSSRSSGWRSGPGSAR